jgi:hypothetical protein
MNDYYSCFVTRMILSRTIREECVLVEHMGHLRSASKILVEKHERKRPLGRIGLDGGVIRNSKK